SSTTWRPSSSTGRSSPERRSMSFSKALQPELGARRAPSSDLWTLLGHPRRVPLVMGIVNVTPDSFYAGSRFGPREAVDEALRQAEAGADLVDIGGQSTRPGSDPVPAEEELRRV